MVGSESIHHRRQRTGRTHLIGRRNRRATDQPEGGWPRSHRAMHSGFLPQTVPPPEKPSGGAPLSPAQSQAKNAQNGFVRIRENGHRWAGRRATTGNRKGRRSHRRRWPRQLGCDCQKAVGRKGVGGGRWRRNQVPRGGQREGGGGYTGATLRETSQRCNKMAGSIHPSHPTGKLPQGFFCSGTGGGISFPFYWPLKQSRS